MDFGGHNSVHEEGFMRLVYFIVLNTQNPKVISLEFTASAGQFILILSIETATFGEKLWHLI